jgi:hypothetical protein
MRSMTYLPRLAVVALAATLLTASFSLFCAVPRVVMPAIAAHPTAFDPAEAEILACQHDSGRSYAQCEAESEGKALIRDAELALATSGASPERLARSRLQ